jgi:hypothetical protein
MRRVLPFTAPPVLARAKRRIRLHRLIERLSLRVRGKRYKHLRHAHNLSLITCELYPIPNIAPCYVVDVLFCMPPPHLLQLENSRNLRQ